MRSLLKSSLVAGDMLGESGIESRWKGLTEQRTMKEGARVVYCGGDRRLEGSELRSQDSAAAWLHDDVGARRGKYKVSEV